MGNKASAAIEGNDVNKLREVLRNKKFDKNKPLNSKDGNTALIEAARGGHIDCVNLLINNDVLLLTRNKAGKTAFDVASDQKTQGAIGKAIMLKCTERENTGVLHKMIKAGIDVNILDANQDSLVMRAASRGLTQTVGILYNHNANLLHRNRYGRDVMDVAYTQTTRQYVATCVCLVAIARNLPAMLEKGLSNATSPEIKTSSGETILVQAVRNNQIQCTEVLLKHGAQVSSSAANGQNLVQLCSSKEMRSLVAGYFLLQACAQSDPKLVDECLTLGADPNQKDKDGIPALILACRQTKGELCAELLLSATPPASAHVYDVVQSALPKASALMWACYNGLSRVTARMLTAGESPEETDSHGMGPMLYAAARGHAGVVYVLADAGVSVNKVDKWGESALHLAVKRNQLAAAEALCLCGAKVDAKTSSGGSAPLHMAVRERLEAMVKLLLDFGASARQLDSNKKSPLDKADRSIKQVLLNHVPIKRIRSKAQSDDKDMPPSYAEGVPTNMVNKPSESKRPAGNSESKGSSPPVYQDNHPLDVVIGVGTGESTPPPYHFKNVQHMSALYTVKVGLGVARGLAHCHKHKIAHCDVRCDNILVSTGERKFLASDMTKRAIGISADKLPKVPWGSLMSRERIGKGNFGVVYKCDLLGLGIPMACKVLKDGSLTDELKQEVETMNMLNDSHVVKVIAIITEVPMSAVTGEPDSEEPHIYGGEESIPQSTIGLLMEMFEYGSLKHLLSVPELRKRWNEGKLVGNLDALDGVVADFGLARLLGKSQGEGKEDDSICYYKQQTSRPIPIWWTAPEVLQSSRQTRKFDPRGDVYMLGCALWEATSRANGNTRFPFFAEALEKASELYEEEHDQKVSSAKALKEFDKSVVLMRVLQEKTRLSFPPSVPGELVTLVNDMTQSIARKRPDMPTVVTRLQAIHDQFIGKKQ